MSQNKVKPVTEREEIVEILEETEIGDSLTIETEFGYKDEQEVFLVEDEYITFGDPVQPAAKMINIERARVHDIPERAEDGFGAGDPIAKLWAWDYSE